MTAVTQVHRQVSELRRVLGQDAIETRPPGYRLPVAPGQLDLERFERLTGEAAADLARGDAARSGEGFREALALWRGEPLADLAFEPFAAPAIARLQELRLAAIEARIEADLALGRTAELVPELDALVTEQPLREHLHGQRILALYRAGRQREALDAYRELRRALVDAFGIEPTPPLQDLERRILRHDPELHAAAASPPPARTRSILVAAHHGDTLDALLRIAEPLAVAPVRELVVVQLVDEAGALPEVAAQLAVRRARLSSPARAAAFTSVDPAADVLRLEAAHEADLVLLGRRRRAGRADAPRGSARAAALSRGGRRRDPRRRRRRGRHRHRRAVRRRRPRLGGVETAAWFALATGQELRLAGALRDDRGGRRDASRLLADASLAIQRLSASTPFRGSSSRASSRCWRSSRAPHSWWPGCRHGGAPTVSGRCAASWPCVSPRRCYWSTAACGRVACHHRPRRRDSPGAPAADAPDGGFGQVAPRSSVL